MFGIFGFCSLFCEGFTKVLWDTCILGTQMWVDTCRLVAGIIFPGLEHEDTSVGLKIPDPT